MAGYDDETVNMGRSGVEPPHPKIDAGRLWAGGAASAVVAALIGLVGVLVIRAVFNVAFAGSREAGVFGDSSTAVLCTLAALAAIAATGLAHLLVLSTPRPLAYLGWIIGLVTAAAVVTPFLSNRPIGVSLAQALIYLVIGLAIGSLVPGAAASAMRSSRRRYEAGPGPSGTWPQ
jgi:uncharacterized membrane protein YuzA (DUF378 family)